MAKVKSIKVLDDRCTRFYDLQWRDASSTPEQFLNEHLPCCRECRENLKSFFKEVNKHPTFYRMPKGTHFNSPEEFLKAWIDIGARRRESLMQTGKKVRTHQVQSIVRQLLMLFTKVAWDCAKTGHPSHARLEGEIISGLLKSLAGLLGHTGFAEYLSFDTHLEELDPLELPGKVEAACKSMLKKLA